MTQFIDTRELDFLAYRDSLKAFLQTQEAFKDYDFEGSNLSVLLDLLALNTTMNAYYENMVGSEMFLDSAVLKDSVVSRSKELNYVPRSRSSARTNVTFSIDPGDLTPPTITIPRYYNVKAVGVDGENQSKEFNFVTNTAIVVQPDSFGNYSVADVEIYQGVAVREAFTANSTARYLLLANTIDVSSVSVEVQASNTDNSTSVWERSLDVYGVNSESNVFFVQGATDDRYELVFGNGVIGRALSNGNIVKVSYVSTDGADGNSLVSFKPTVAVEGFTVSSIVADERATGGSERESISSVKFHAPRHFTTQERAVTERDFENIVRENFPVVQSVLAFGGERLDPPQFGRVALFIKPFGTEGVISDNLKRRIVNLLKGKSITTEAFVVNPEYFYLRVVSSVQYDPLSLRIPLEQLRANVISAMEDFADATLTDFDSDLRYSKFVKAIDDADDAIVSNDTSVSIVRRWSPTTSTVASLEFSYGAPLRKYDVKNEIERGIDPTFTSSVFSYVINGISYAARLEDNGIGGVKVVANNSARTVLNSSVGTIDYDTGDVELNVAISSYSGYVSLYAVPAEKDVEVSEHRFLILDASDVTVNMVTD